MRNHPRFSRHLYAPPLVAERAHTIGCRIRHIRATSCYVTGDHSEPRVNESIVTEK